LEVFPILVFTGKQNVVNQNRVRDVSRRRFSFTGHAALVVPKAAIFFVNHRLRDYAHACFLPAGERPKGSNTGFSAFHA
jgi:hypothetical protein